MATFLQLCQRLASESGSTAASLSTVSGHGAGHLHDLINWVSQAWIDIQNMHESWRFLRSEFEHRLTQSSGGYTASTMDVQNFGSWLVGHYGDTMTIYDPDIGVSDEGALRFLEWDRFNREFRRGAQSDSKPVYWSAAPDEVLWVGPAPDKAYTLRGEYIRSPQVLTADSDVPLCPARFHLTIVWYALMSLSEYDGGNSIDIVASRRKYLSALSDMERSQLPTLRLAEALA